MQRRERERGNEGEGKMSSEKCNRERDRPRSLDSCPTDASGCREMRKARW
jgi:hypothetical protein